MKIEAGKSYVDGHGDVHGPMEERQPGVWIDQYGGVFEPDGTQWNHRPESFGNLTRDATNADVQNEHARDLREAVRHGPGSS